MNAVEQVAPSAPDTSRFRAEKDGGGNLQRPDERGDRIKRWRGQPALKPPNHFQREARRIGKLDLRKAAFFPTFA